MSLTRKLQSVTCLSPDQIRLIARYLPRDSDSLDSSIAQNGAISDDARDRVLAITCAHARDQALFDECLSHVRAFSSGGLSGMQRLNEVFDVIIGHFGMEKEKWEILASANVGMDFQTGRLSLRMARD